MIPIAAIAAVLCHFLKGGGAMETQLHISAGDVQKLLCSANGDAALLYLHLLSGGTGDNARQALKLTDSRLSVAAATLRQMGLWQEKKPAVMMGERPQYAEGDVIRAMDTDGDFRSLYGEVQRLLGRSLNTEELKILLGFVRYLGLPSDVIYVLVCYCKDRARQKGNTRNPSLRTIEKEAYFWAEQGIDTMEEAAAFIQRQNIKNSQLRKLTDILQIRGRSLTPAEERYANAWLEMGFDQEALANAYERTCLNTGGLSWAYMNKILLRWQENGMITGEQVKNGDRKPSGATGQLGQAELDAIHKLLKED